MAVVKGPQFYCDDSIPSEQQLIKWIKSLESNKKRGSKSSATVKILTAGVYLNTIDPRIVDFLVSEFDQEKQPSMEYLNNIYSLLSGINESKKSDVLIDDKKEQNPDDGFLTLGQ